MQTLWEYQSAIWADFPGYKARLQNIFDVAYLKLQYLVAETTGPTQSLAIASIPEALPGP